MEKDIVKDEAYYKALDKRTKEYKEWKASFEKQSKGLGDTVEKITKATGIKKAVKFVAGEDCGCNKRKEKLNQIFRYNKPECLTENEYTYITKEIPTYNLQAITHYQQAKLLTVHNRVFKGKLQMSSCGKCVGKVIDDLNKLIGTYK